MKYLGVYIDRSLTWKSHFDKVWQKCFAGLATINRAGYLPCHIRKLLYQSLVLPHLDYCAVAWHSCGVAMSDRIEQIQNYAMRVILRQPPRTSSKQLQQDLGWTTLWRRGQNTMLCQVHRCLQKCTPPYLTSKFVMNSALGYTVTRRANKLHLNRPYKTMLPNFVWVWALHFNNLPASVQSLTSRTAFKAALSRIDIAE